jgi:hypothetical protein
VIKIDKRGQIGRILTSLPVLLIVIVVMGAFIFLSFTIAKFKGPEQQRAVGVIDTNMLPLEITNVNSGSEIKSMWVLDSLLLFLNGQKSKSITYIYQLDSLKQIIASNRVDKPMIISLLLQVNYDKANVNSVDILDSVGIACYYYFNDRPKCYGDVPQIYKCINSGYGTLIRFKYNGKDYTYETYLGKPPAFNKGVPSC